MASIYLKKNGQQYEVLASADWWFDKRDDLRSPQGAEGAEMLTYSRLAPVLAQESRNLQIIKPDRRSVATLARLCL